MLVWFYLAGKDSKITSIPMIGCSSRSMTNYFSNLKSDQLQRSTHQSIETLQADILESISKRPLEILAASSSSTQDYMQKLTQMQSQNNDKLTKLFKKIPPKYRNMLLVALGP